jgi:hypothetical protein
MAHMYNWQVNSSISNNYNFTLCQKIFIQPLLLLVITGGFYFYINNNITPFSNWLTLKYSAGDSTTYLDVGKWLLNEKSFSEVQSSIAIRPFLYPLLVAASENIHPWAIILFQYILWQSQIIIIYLTGLSISKSDIRSFTLALCCASMMSPLAISLHVLTETTVSFLFIFAFFLFIKYLTNRQENRLLFFYLLSLSLCSVVKPSCFYIFLLNIPLAFFIWKNKSVRGLFIALLILLPIIFQYAIMQKNFKIYKLSVIDSKTVNDYFLSALEVYKQNNYFLNGSTSKLNRKYKNRNNGFQKMFAVRVVRRNNLAKMVDQGGYKKTALHIKTELIQNITEYPTESLNLFLAFIKSNFSQGSVYTLSKSDHSQGIYLPISYWQNIILNYLNITSAILLFFLTYKNLVKKEVPPAKSISFFSINYYIISIISFTYVSSGVSGFQGDRLITIILFISLIWFFYQLEMFFSVYQQQRKNCSPPTVTDMVP